MYISGCLHLHGDCRPRLAPDTETSHADEAVRCCWIWILLVSSPSSSWWVGGRREEARDARLEVPFCGHITDLGIYSFPERSDVMAMTSHTIFAFGQHLDTGSVDVTLNVPSHIAAAGTATDSLWNGTVARLRAARCRKDRQNACLWSGVFADVGP